VTGIDFAPAMIDRANALAEQAASRGLRVPGSRFPRICRPQRDVSTALASSTTCPIPNACCGDAEARARRSWMSFPRRGSGVPIRWMRFRMMDVPLFSTRGAAPRRWWPRPHHNAEWIVMDRDYLVIGRPLVERRPHDAGARRFR